MKKFEVFYKNKSTMIVKAESMMESGEGLKFFIGEEKEGSLCFFIPSKDSIQHIKITEDGLEEQVEGPEEEKE